MWFKFTLLKILYAVLQVLRSMKGPLCFVFLLSFNKSRKGMAHFENLNPDETGFLFVAFAFRHLLSKCWARFCAIQEKGKFIRAQLMRFQHQFCSLGSKKLDHFTKHWWVYCKTVQIIRTVAIKNGWLNFHTRRRFKT